MTSNLTETQNIRTPFKADHVGSFLRPQRLKDAREQFSNGSITREELTRVEDEEIGKLVQAQLENGLSAVTDGEFRRSWWHLDFLAGLDGIEFREVENGTRKFTGIEVRPVGIKVTGKIGYSGNHPFIHHFRKLKEIAGDGTPVKFTIPSPNLVFGRAALETDVYQKKEEFYQDVIPAYHALIRDLYDAGCRYLQIDDTAWTSFFTEEERNRIREDGSDPDRLILQFAEAINGAIADRPDDLLVTMHICRGNFRSTHFTSGSYEAAGKVIFGGLDVDGLFLEFDDDRSGGFEPLRHVTRPDLTVVLGLVTSKHPELEDEELIKARIREASEFLPLEQLALSPQCGFASTEEGNKLTEDEQWAKIRHVVKIAEDVWGK
ncbi:5-methyltetrahydropteroyltriglutamate--homocysteine methyltransferase [Bhargavaea cecembensis]|uniref:5-methyltetrahydropteroyltriglutamate--homocysteine methyltransferase n=1 Tax=Bhargavaea cecembensis TaxID=394098 RepID=A0A163F1P8_9BACL|nr:5-methyltetrahydropteroyltriglutamate--homocysteine S-methyltransferase [Bhargavaea cecembensis]KZE37741.1 5-methyltetrahydropteroyltriglutamate--homocysteine methyltransferase [Bhargavaea cecembensis]